MLAQRGFQSLRGKSDFIQGTGEMPAGQIPGKVIQKFHMKSLGKGFLPLGGPWGDPIDHETPTRSKV